MSTSSVCDRNAISLWLDLISIFFYFDFGCLLQIGKGALFTTQFVDVLYHEQKIVTHVFCYFCWMSQNTGPVRIRGTRSLGVLFLSLERRGVWESESVFELSRFERAKKHHQKRGAVLPSIKVPRGMAALNTLSAKRVIFKWSVCLILGKWRTLHSVAFLVLIH